MDDNKQSKDDDVDTPVDQSKSEPDDATNTVELDKEEKKSEPADGNSSIDPAVATPDIADQFENMTIFGNKSLEELKRIQSKKSHLSAGALLSYF